jgi:hypothetical protein
MAIMRERAQVGGGNFEVTSVPGEGTTIVARFPSSLLQQEPEPPPGDGGGAPAMPATDASSGTSGTNGPGDERSPARVRASS